MFVPVFDNVKYVQENGFLTPQMQIYTDQLNQSIQGALSDNGWILPEVTDTELVEVEPKMPNGTMWYEKTNHLFVIKINNALRKVTTTAYP